MADADDPTRDQLDGLWGCSVRDHLDAHVGTLEDVFYDERDSEPDWFAIGTGLLGRRLVLVPANGAVVRGFTVVLAFGADVVKGAPELRNDDLDADTVQGARDYYARAPLEAP